VSHHVSVLLFGIAMLAFGVETAIKRRSPGSARSAAVHGTPAVLVGVLASLLGAAVIGGAIAEWVRPGLF
jgi:hypothetical protein